MTSDLIDNAPTEAGEKDSKRLLQTAFLSLIFPGVGHLLLHRNRKASVLMFLFLIIIFCYWPLRVPHSLAGFLLLVCGILVLLLFTLMDACYSRHNKSRLSQWWLLLLLPLALIAASAHSNWLVRASGFQLFLMPSESMVPTIPRNNRMIVDRRYYQNHAPTRGDIVIYLNPQNFYIIKRVIARAGETIASRDGKVFINGTIISEPYAVRSGNAPYLMDNFGPMKIPQGRLFVMGDNRDVSLDSRSPEIGPIDENSLRGKPLYLMGDFKHRTYKTLQ